MYIPPQPDEYWRIGNLRRIFEERPKLYAADETREDFGEIELHKIENTAVQQPRESDERNGERQFDDGAPRLLALEIPRFAGTFGHGTAGGDTRYEVDADKDDDTRHH